MNIKSELNKPLKYIKELTFGIVLTAIISAFLIVIISFAFGTSGFIKTAFIFIIG